MPPGISTWDDLVQTANLVRAALGVSPDAWNQACEVMGAIDAAIVIAAILQRSDQIASAGGYLRALTDKARQGPSRWARRCWRRCGPASATMRPGPDEMKPHPSLSCRTRSDAFHFRNEDGFPCIHADLHGLVHRNALRKKAEF